MISLNLPGKEKNTLGTKQGIQDIYQNEEHIMFSEQNWRALAQAVVTAMFTVLLFHGVNYLGYLIFA